MKKESAIPQMQVQQPVVAKAPIQLQHVVDGVMKRLNKEQTELFLSVLANPDYRAVNQRIILEMQTSLAELAAYEYLSDEEFAKVRIQVVGVSSLLARCNELGKAHEEKGHVLNQQNPETETPIVGE